MGLKEVQKDFSEWTATMAHDPSSLSEVEHKASKFAQTIAGLLTAAVLAQAQVTESVEQCVQDRHPRPFAHMRYVAKRKLKVMLLCGLTMLVFATYWVPRRDPRRYVESQWRPDGMAWHR